MTQLYVGNLAYLATEPELRRLFERFGRVGSIRLASDPATGRGRGFAFIGMSRMEDAEEAVVNLHGSQYLGRKLVVNEAREKRSPQNESERQCVLARLNLM